MAYWNSRYSSRYEDRWPAYVPVAERRRKAEKEMEKLRKKGVPVSPVKIEGKQIAATFWGRAWCDNLESYRDYENRLPRGRTYVRNGSVVDLQIAPREVTAMVSGSSIYKVKVTIGEVAKAHWKSICADCSGGIDSLVELLQGRFSKGVMERICRQGAGLFPKPKEIKFSCSCPDGAVMCKHVAAVMYGVGARLDTKPELLFQLRAVNEKDLVADIGKVLPMTTQGPAAGKVLETDDMAALFGLDLGGAEDPGDDAPAAVQANPTSRPKRRLAVRKPAEAAPVKPDKRVTVTPDKAVAKPKSRLKPATRPAAVSSRPVARPPVLAREPARPRASKKVKPPT